MCGRRTGAYQKLRTDVNDKNTTYHLHNTFSNAYYDFFSSLEQNIHYKIGKCKLCRRVVTCVILFKTVVCSRELDVSTNAQEGLILTVNL